MTLPRPWSRSLQAALTLLSLGAPAPAQHRRHSCPEGQHESGRYHCCGPGEAWVDERNACVCLDCNGCPPPGSTAPGTPAPPPPPPPPQCLEGMVYIPGGLLNMGSAPGEGDANEGPQHRVILTPYCIDRTEVTIGQYHACVNSGACTPAGTQVTMRSLPASEASFWSTFCNGARTDRDTHPINCVDWSQAQALCQSRGGRLPTEAEWEFTARGADGRRAPWGGTPPAANLLNACGAECPSIGERPNRARWPVMFDRTDGYDTTAPVGSYLQGASPFGVQDLIGNVLEWTGDWFGPYTATPSPVANPTGPATGTQRVARGGVHWQSSNAQQARSAVRLPGDPTWRLATLGFRCAASPGSTPPAPAAPAAPSAPPAPAPAAVPTGC